MSGIYMDEFDKLMGLFSEESANQEKKLDEIFERSSEFFESYKDVMAQGSTEDKQAMQQKMNILREKLKTHAEETQKKLGMSGEEVRSLSADPKNFTKKQWEFLEQAKERLFQEKREQSKKIESAKEQRVEGLQDKKKKKPTSRKSGWMKS